MKNKYGLLFAFLFLFISGIMNSQSNVKMSTKQFGSKVEFGTYFNPNPFIATLVFRWDFGDGSNYNTNSYAAFTHKYNQIGTYQVTLIASDTTGNLQNDTIIKNIDILCVADFTYNTSGSIVSFYDASKIDTFKVTANNIDYFWIYSDSNHITKQGKNNNHTFPATGTYTAKHIVYDTTTGSSCKDTIEKTINLSAGCQAKFAYSINGKNASFYDSSTIINSSATKYLWYFDNSVTSTLHNPTQTFLKNKDYLVSLTITDTVNNCTSTYADTVKIGPNCRPDFNFTVHPTNSFKYYYSDNSIVPSANTTYSWTSGSSNKNDSITYGAIGSYALCLTIQDSVAGCNENICKIINVVENCNARFKYTIKGDSVTAVADTNTAFMHHTWNAGGNLYYTPSIKLQFPIGSINTICHQIIDSAKGCSNSWCDTVWIPCKIDFTYSVNGDSVQFNGSSTSSGTIYSWNFGDGDTSNLQNPLHVYAVSDTVYQVSFTIKNNIGCNGTVNKNITIGFPKQDIWVNYSKHPYDPNAIPCYAARLYLIEYDSANQALAATDSVDVYNDSLYIFKNVDPGKYFVKAALLPSDSDYYDYLPTYGDTALLWSNAQTAVHTLYSSTHMRIHFIQGSNPGGSGFIAGYVYQGANKKEGPLENIDVYLTLKDGTPVTFAKTDVEGKYEFNNLAFGEYKLWVEIVGKPSDVYDIIINQNMPTTMEINFDVNKDAIVKRTPNASVNSIQNNNLKLYPNPVNDFLTINLEENTNNLEVEVYDINGSLIIKNKMINGEKLDVSNIKTGIYYIQIQTESTTIFRQKFLKD